MGLVKHISLFFSLKAEILACRRADRHFYRFLEAFQTVSERQINPLKKRKQRIKLAPATSVGLPAEALAKAGANFYATCSHFNYSTVEQFDNFLRGCNENVGICRRNLL
ncbi:MAG: hypothetical protein ACYSYU_09480, partial [Planctomycetota bacterium]